MSGKPDIIEFIIDIDVDGTIVAMFIDANNRSERFQINHHYREPTGFSWQYEEENSKDWRIEAPGYRRLTPSKDE